jgi:hypothetical protein
MRMRGEGLAPVGGDDGSCAVDRRTLLRSVAVMGRPSRVVALSPLSRSLSRGRTRRRPLLRACIIKNVK